MTIQIHMTNKEAAAVAKQVRASGNTSIQWVADHIEAEIEDQRQTAPWRKVVNSHAGQGIGAGYEVLECGHHYHLKYGRRWVQDGALKRRCKDCETD